MRKWDNERVIIPWFNYFTAPNYSIIVPGDKKLVELVWSIMAYQNCLFEDALISVTNSSDDDGHQQTR